MVGVAENLCSGPVRCDVPRVEVSDRGDLARLPIHSAETMRPNCEDDVAGAAEECLVNDELVVSVVIEALHSGSVTPDAMHSRRGVTRENQPVGVRWVELRMDDGSWEWNQRPF